MKRLLTFIAAMILAVLGGWAPVAGQAVVLHGRVVDGVPRVGTEFTP